MFIVLSNQGYNLTNYGPRQCLTAMEITGRGIGTYPWKQLHQPTYKRDVNQWHQTAYVPVLFEGGLRQDTLNIPVAAEKFYGFCRLLARAYLPPSRTMQLTWYYTIFGVVRWNLVRSVSCHNEASACISFLLLLVCIYVTRHNKTGQLSVTKKNVIFLLSEREFY